MIFQKIEQDSSELLRTIITYNQPIKIYLYKTEVTIYTIYFPCLKCAFKKEWFSKNYFSFQLHIVKELKHNRNGKQSLSSSGTGDWSRGRKAGFLNVRLKTNGQHPGDPVRRPVRAFLPAFQHRLLCWTRRLPADTASRDRFYLLYSTRIPWNMPNLPPMYLPCGYCVGSARTSNYTIVLCSKSFEISPRTV